MYWELTVIIINNIKQMWLCFPTVFVFNIAQVDCIIALIFWIMDVDSS